MKIKITHPVDNFEAGLVYDVPDDQAKEYIAADFAAVIEDENLVDVTTDQYPVYIEGKRKVKRDKRKNGS